MAARQQWFDTLRLSIRQEHGKGWSVWEVGITKRNLSLKIFDFQAPEPVGGNRIKQVVKLRKGLSQELAKTLSKTVRDQLKKVTVAIQGDSLRVTGKSKDDLQAAIQLLKAQDVEVPLQFKNFR